MESLERDLDAHGNGARTRVLTELQDVELGVSLGCGATLEDPVDAQDRLCRYGDYEYEFDANAGCRARRT